MKHHVAKRLTCLLLACFLLMGLVPAAAHATNLSGICYASNLVSGEDIVLTGNTVLFMNTNLTLKSISGPYNLEIQGTGRLKVENPQGTAVKVANLTSSAPLVLTGAESALLAESATLGSTVELYGGDAYYAAYAVSEFEFDGTRLEAEGGGGIQSASVSINGSNVSVITDNGSAIAAYNGSVHVDSDQLFVQCTVRNTESGGLTGIEATEDITVISQDGTIAGYYGIRSDRGDISVSGNIWVGGAACAIHAPEGAVELSGSITTQGGDNSYAIAAKDDLTFAGARLDAAGDFGITSNNGNVILNAEEVSVFGQVGAGVIAHQGSIDIDSDTLFVQSAIAKGGALWENGIDAAKDITIESGNATIAGRQGVYSEAGDITLTGAFGIGALESALFTQCGDITVDGDLTASNADEGYYCIVTTLGDILLTGGVFDITSQSNALVAHEGNICLDGDITAECAGTDSVAVDNRQGNIVIRSGPLDLTAGRYAIRTYNGLIQMGEGLSIRTPAGGRNDYNVIVDASGNPASHVQIDSMIESVSVWVNEPLAGMEPVTTAADVYGLDRNCSVKSVAWYENGMLFEGDTFTAGNNYHVRIVLEAREGYAFQPGFMGQVNGEDVTTKLENGHKEMILTRDFGECPNTIGHVELTVTAPKEGDKPSYTIGCASNAYYAVGSTSNYTDYRQWYMSYDNETWQAVGPDHQFLSGCCYKLCVDIRTKSGYEFPLTDVGTIQPDVTATVNGGEARVIKAYDQDPASYITVEYNFGICAETVVQHIKINGVTKPFPGEKPVYDADVLVYGCRLSGKEASEEVYEGGQYVRKTFIRNGIGWYDLTAEKWVYETDIFLAGHDYIVNVYLQTEEGHTFSCTRDYEPLVTASVNGDEARICTSGSDALYNQQVQYTFGHEVENFFTDVPENSFYYGPVMWAISNGITNGATATTFNPVGSCLRAHVVTFLHRAFGNTEPTSAYNPFNDVKTADFFYKPVLWAVEKGITNGTSATTFGSFDNCNRAAVVTFLWRAAGSPEPQSTENPFVDVKPNDFFYKPVLWAVENGITNGVDATHFGPNVICNRAQVVTFLYRAYH